MKEPEIQEKLIQPRAILLVGLTLAAAAARVAPHPWNVTPVGGLALFGGATFRNRRAAFLVPIVSMFLGDLIIGLHRLTPIVYASFLLSVVIGFWLRGRRTVPRIGAATLAGAVQFFLVTNFGMWAMGGAFPRTALGLASYYVAGIPYFWNTLAGDVLYSALLFGTLAVAEWRFPALREAPITAHR